MQFHLLSIIHCPCSGAMPKRDVREVLQGHTGNGGQKQRREDLTKRTQNVPRGHDRGRIVTSEL